MSKRIQKWDTTKEVYHEVCIEVHFTGYYDPGRTYGEPENCYPPEGDDEREIVSMMINGKELKFEGKDAIPAADKEVLEKYFYPVVLGEDCPEPDDDEGPPED